MEREYRDGTEPTVLPHFDQRDIHPMRVCRGFGCLQGRKVCPHPEHCTLPAEACNDTGDESPTVRSELERILLITIVIASAAAVIGFIGGLLS